MSVPSPCRNVCRYDTDGTCIGCRRTREEITGWIGYSDIEKLAVWEKIRQRRNLLNSSEAKAHGTNLRTGPFDKQRPGPWG